MGRDAKMLSAVAVAVLLAALALVVFMQLPDGGDGQKAEGSVSIATPAAKTGSVTAGKVATDFKLRDLGGREVSLSSMRGKVVFLNLWATWCEPCRREMPSIEKLYEKFGRDKSFVILAVSEDSDGSKAVAPYVKQSGYRFEILLDPRNDVGEAYNVSGIPETFVIDRDGRIVAHHLGPYNWANPDIRDALQELINSKTG
jgi:cytochrome c biogenesis protein CcmG/thiol:disulfide interchange protein DsbE